MTRHGIQHLIGRELRLSINPLAHCRHHQGNATRVDMSGGEVLHTTMRGVASSTHESWLVAHCRGVPRALGETDSRLRLCLYMVDGYN